MRKKNRKNVQNPIMQHLMYILVPVVALGAFYFIGIGAKWVFESIGKMGWAVPITFVVTSIGWNVFYGLKEMNEGRMPKEKEDPEYDEYEEDEYDDDI